MPEFKVGDMYASNEIQNILGGGNAGGVRVCVGDDGAVRRAIILTAVPSARQANENPYHDRIENGILVYTGAGREGDQSLAGINKRLPQQSAIAFPIYGFLLVGSRRDASVGPKRWQFLGLLEYLRHYPDSQVDARGDARRVWLFEFRIHAQPGKVDPASDCGISEALISESRRTRISSPEEQEVIGVGNDARSDDAALVEVARAKLLVTNHLRRAQKLSSFVNAAGIGCEWDAIIISD